MTATSGYQEHGYHQLFPMQQKMGFKRKRLNHAPASELIHPYHHPDASHSDEEYDDARVPDGFTSSYYVPSSLNSLPSDDVMLYMARAYLNGPEVCKLQASCCALYRLFQASSEWLWGGLLKRLLHETRFDPLHETHEDHHTSPNLKDRYIQFHLFYIDISRCGLCHHHTPRVLSPILPWKVRLCKGCAPLHIVPANHPMVVQAMASHQSLLPRAWNALITNPADHSTYLPARFYLRRDLPYSSISLQHMAKSETNEKKFNHRCVERHERLNWVNGQLASRFGIRQSIFRILNSVTIPHSITEKTIRYLTNDSETGGVAQAKNMDRVIEDIAHLHHLDRSINAKLGVNFTASKMVSPVVSDSTSVADFVNLALAKFIQFRSSSWDVLLNLATCTHALKDMTGRQDRSLHLSNNHGRISDIIGNFSRDLDMKRRLSDLWALKVRLNELYDSHHLYGSQSTSSCDTHQPRSFEEFATRLSESSWTLKGYRFIHFKPLFAEAYWTILIGNWSWNEFVMGLILSQFKEILIRELAKQASRIVQDFDRFIQAQAQQVQRELDILERLHEHMEQLAQGTTHWFPPLFALADPEITRLYSSYVNRGNECCAHHDTLCLVAAVKNIFGIYDSTRLVLSVICRYLPWVTSLDTASGVSPNFPRLVKIVSQAFDRQLDSNPDQKFEAIQPAIRAIINLEVIYHHAGADLEFTSSVEDDHDDPLMRDYVSPVSFISNEVLEFDLIQHATSSAHAWPVHQHYEVRLRGAGLMKARAITRFLDLFDGLINRHLTLVKEMMRRENIPLSNGKEGSCRIESVIVEWLVGQSTVYHHRLSSRPDAIPNTLLNECGAWFRLFVHSEMNSTCNSALWNVITHKIRKEGRKHRFEARAVEIRAAILLDHRFQVLFRDTYERHHFVMEDPCFQALLAASELYQAFLVAGSPSQEMVRAATRQVIELIGRHVRGDIAAEVCYLSLDYFHPSQDWMDRAEDVMDDEEDDDIRGGGGLRRFDTRDPLA